MVPAVNPSYIWQSPAWCKGASPRFTWDEAALAPVVDKLHVEQGRLLNQSESLAEDQKAAHLDALIQTALRTSEIEGETLNVASVHSSVVRHLGLESAGFVAGKHSSTPQTESLVKLLIEATESHAQPLSQSLLCDWQAALFPEPPLVSKINIGQLRGEALMQVLSGRIENPTVHFEAPPRVGLEQELDRFITWFNHPPSELDGLLRAGIAHLWLITLHPFDDGNGRVTRAVTDRALAQAENNSIRYYSLSAAIMARRKEYYLQLEQAQKIHGGASRDIDITPWLQWFLSVLSDALAEGKHRFDRVLQKTRFWRRHAQTILSQRQMDVLNRLLDSHGEEFTNGINASKYQALAKVSKATATRELSDLLNKHCILKLPGGGRSTRYCLNVSA